MEEKKAREQREKQQLQQLEAKEEAEMAAYNPWGKGGAGAPLRDRGGNVVADLHKIKSVPCACARACEAR